jgi:hypothetical protein
MSPADAPLVHHSVDRAEASDALSCGLGQRGLAFCNAFDFSKWQVRNIVEPRTFIRLPARPCLDARRPPMVCRRMQTLRYNFEE